MGLPFFESGARIKRDQMLAIDLGGRMTKAVHLQRRGNGFALCRYIMMEAPIYEKSLSVELLTEHLKAVAQSLEAKTRLASVAVGVNDAIVRHVDMLRIPTDDMRMVLKNNSKNYLQQELPNHVFDCFITPPRAMNDSKNPAGTQKQRILVAGAKKQLADDYIAAIKAAGLTPDYLVPGLIAPVNAFEKASPDIFSKEIAALVDIGFKNSSICIVQDGELVLSRVVAIGGDRLTAGIAESMGISYAEAEGIKVGMAGEVESQLEPLLTPLGRELRASIDFFEHQQEKPVAHVFVSGGSAASELVLRCLQNEMMIECKTWNPVSFCEMALPADQAAEINQIAPQLVVAMGAAMAAF